MAESRRHLQGLVPAGDRCSMLACDGAIADVRLRCCDPCWGPLLAAIVAQVWQRERETYIARLIDDLADWLSDCRLDGLIEVLAGYLEVAPGGNLRLRDGVEHYLDLLAVTSSRGSVWP